MASTFGGVLRRAREVRKLSGIEAARLAGISAAYLSKLENNAVKRPSPPVLHKLGEALTVPYAELMRLAGYPIPGEAAGTDPGTPAETVNAALFANLSSDEREELLEYLAWYRARRGSNRGSAGAG